MFTVAVGRKAGGDIKAGLSGGNDIEKAARNNASQNLRDDIRYKVFAGEPPSHPQSNRDCRIQMTTGDMK
jgi:hypothetical protein